MTPPLRFDPPIIGSSAAAARLRDLILTLCGSAVSVLITGESGVGKEVLAKNLHRFSPRRREPFVAINCAALSPGTLESELFGHNRGAFTGAIRTHTGLFEQAHTGTLFLDEIGEVPGFVQAKLLRVLQEREVRRMGDGIVRRVDVRIISATNADLASMVDSGRFRTDLFYRLNVVEVYVPPLRQRQEDIFDLVTYFFESQNATEPVITDEARVALCRYSWPGNIRELRNELERIRALHGRIVRLTPGMLSPRITQEVGNTKLDVKILYDAPLSSAVSYLEENLLKQALIQTNWNKSKTARQLGLSRQGLLKKIKRYGIQRQSLGDPIDEAT